MVKKLAKQKGKYSAGFTGRHHTEESKEKMRKKLKGRFVGKKNPWYGKHHSEENRKKQSVRSKKWWKDPINYKNMCEMSRNRKHTEEEKRKIGRAHKGLKHTEESKRKMSESHKGFKHTEEWKEQHRKDMLGRKHTRKTKEHLRKINIGRKHTEKVRKKISEKAKGRPSPMKGKEFSRTHKRKLREHHANVSESKNPRWEGGVSRAPYSIKWTSKLKKEVAERDKYVCQFCEKKALKGCPHHYTYSKRANIKGLVWVHLKCNSRLNRDRDYWFACFCYQFGYEPEDAIEY